ncbi:MAG: hypothetical protein PUA69_07340 [Erysipelotrichaceae bacterium]|nr:hypothetical protein [Erysipelotrichaceae bacterium]
MNKSYFKWLFDSRKNISVFLFIIEVILGFLPFFMNGTDSYDYQMTLSQPYKTGIASITIASIIAAVVLPMLLFNYIHKKNSIDLYFSLPVSRRDQLITTILFSWISIFGSFLISTLLIYVFYGSSSISFGNWLILQPWMAFGILVILLFTTCIYTLTNNMLDGFIIVGAYALLPFLISITIEVFVSNMVAGTPYGQTSYLWIYFSPLLMTCCNLAGLCHITSFSFSPSYIPVLTLFLVISCIGLHKNFIERKSERAEQVSDSIFAYPFISNIYLLLLLLMSAFSTFNSSRGTYDLIFYFLLLLCYVIASFVYHRSVRLHWSYLLGYVICLGLSFLIAFAGWQTHGFGIADHYTTDAGKYLVYEYSMNCDPDDLGKADDESNISVDVTLKIPVSKEKDYQEAMDLMEELRKTEIKDYYNHKNTYSYYGALTVYNPEYNPDTDAMNSDTSSNFWYYSISHAISEDQLMMLERYGDIEIYDNNESKPAVSLREYLEQRGKKS